jgi:hypothetical protein
MRIRIAALAALSLAALAIPLAVAASQPPQLTPAAANALHILVADPYEAQPLQVSLVSGFATLDEMI